MNPRRVAVQGLLAGQRALSVATQGVQPLRVAFVGGGGSVRVPRDLIDAQRLRLIGADDLLLLMAGAAAAGLLH